MVSGGYRMMAGPTIDHFFSMLLMGFAVLPVAAYKCFAETLLMYY